MVQTRSQTKAKRECASYCEGLDPNRIIELSSTTGFNEYVTAYKRVTFQFGPFIKKIEANMIKQLKIAWNQLEDSVKREWNSKAELYRFLATTPAI